MDRLRRFYTVTAIQWLNTTIVFLCVVGAMSVAYRALDRWRVWRRPDKTHFNARAMKTLSPAEGLRIFSIFSPEFVQYDYRPWVGHAEHVFQSPRVHIDDGQPLPIRRTIDPPLRPGPERTVWLFGGSTVFGLGVPDEYTIATRLASSLAAAMPGLNVHVVNHGHISYYSSQEVALFQWLIRSGQHPDLVIFIDGLNEAWHPLDIPDDTQTVSDAFESSKHSIAFSQRFAPARFFHDLLMRTTAASAERVPPPREQAHREAAVYLRNVAATRAIAQTEGIPAVFVWQPTPFEAIRVANTPAERWTRASMPEMPSMQPLNAFVRPAFSHSRDMVWLADIFADRSFLDTYVDACHYGDDASILLAEAISREVIAHGVLH